MKKSIMIMALALTSLSVIAQQDQKEIAVYETDVKFQDQLAALYESSLVLTEAFVSSDPAVVKQKSSEVKSAMKNVDMMLLKGQAHMDWMKYRKVILSSISTFETAHNIADQRVAYADFSTNLYNSVKAFGVNGKEVFYQHCPMAMSGQGAFWLSNKAEIRNPYYGSSMMTCGSTKEKINE
jgi:membrane fusion protein, copper/silver efflux system